MRISLKSDLDDLARHLRRNSPRAIQRAGRAAINNATRKLRTTAKRDIAEETGARKVGTIGKLVTSRLATGNSLTSFIDFSELGIGLENTKKATIRKARGRAGRYNVTMKGQGKFRAFRLGKTKGPAFIRSKGKVKRLFAYTALQSAQKINLYEEMSEKAVDLFIPEFIRTVDVFDGYNGRSVAITR